MFRKRYYTKPYFNHGLNSLEQMQEIWDNIMWERRIDEMYAEYEAYRQTDQYWKDYMVAALEDFTDFPYAYGMGEVA